MRKVLGKIKNESLAKKARRRLSIRKKVVGSSERPRICAVRTNKHLTVQVIDDATSKTIFSAQSYGKNAIEGSTNTVAGAKVLGAAVAEGLKKSNINVAVFDRAGYRYTGVIAALVDSIRENGIQI